MATTTPLAAIVPVADTAPLAATPETKTDEARFYERQALMDHLVVICSGMMARAAQHFSSQELDDATWAAAAAILSAVDSGFRPALPEKVRGDKKLQMLFELVRHTSTNTDPKQVRQLLHVFSVSLKSKTPPDLQSKTQEIVCDINSKIDAIEEADGMNSLMDSDAE